ncbi:MAG: DUF4274 domain-containing protein, partial [Pseudomonadota bacterium]
SWHSVISHLNYDSPETYEVIEWILSQPDCDALLALRAFDYLEGHCFCALSASDKYVGSSKEVALVRLIAEREKSGPQYKSDLKCDYLSRGGLNVDELIEKARVAQSELKAGELPAAEIPVHTLKAAGRGKLPLEEYSVDECGILALPKSQAAILN